MADGPVKLTELTNVLDAKSEQPTSAPLDKPVEKSKEIEENDMPLVSISEVVVLN